MRPGVQRILWLAIPWALVGAMTACGGAEEGDGPLACSAEADCRCNIATGDSGSCHWFGNEVSQAIISTTQDVGQAWGCFADSATEIDSDAAPCCYRETCSSTAGHCELSPREDELGDVSDPRCTRAALGAAASAQCGPFVAASGDLIYLCLGASPSTPECFFPDPVEVLGGNYIYVPDPSMFIVPDGSPSDCRTVCAMEGEGIGALADCPLDELAVALATSMSMSSASIPVACKVPGLEKAAEIDALLPRYRACDDGDSCTEDTCAEGSNECISTTLPDGASCDLSPLLNDETCMSGVCTHVPCDDGNPCTLDNLETKGCTYTPVAGLPCGDGVGICDDDGACIADTSDCPASCGGDADCSSCQPANACLGEVGCVGGKCAVKAQTMVICPSHPSPCASQICDPTSGACVYLEAGTPCIDQSECTQDESCDGQGQCIAGSATIPDCESDSDCQACASPTSCSATTKCSVSGKCEAPAPPPDEITEGCMQWVCDTTTGALVQSPVPDGTSCTDNNTCTTFEACHSGQCVGVVPNCSDGVECTLDSCDATLGCVHEADDAACANDDVCTIGSCDPSLDCVYEFSALPCDDGNACTSGDVCGGGACAGTDTSPVDCDDGNVCTTDACEAVLGCTHIPNNVACDDGDGCTDNDTCSNGGCGGTDSSTIDCDDGNPCTIDGCDPQGACVHVPSAELCDDGDACTTGDVCSNGVCAGTDTSAVACDDGDLCTDDSCDPSGGCEHASNAALCADDNPCTDDICDPLTGCSNPFSVLPCDDGDACTTGDVCDNGVCAGSDTSTLDCDDTNICTEDSCHPVDGCQNVASDAVCDDDEPCTIDGCDSLTGCFHVPVSVSCDDGNACTTDDQCGEDGVCAGSDTSQEDCDDGLDCTVDVCDAATGCAHLPNPALCSSGDPCTSSACLPGAGCVHEVLSECCEVGAVSALPGCTAILFNDSVYQVCPPSAATCDGVVSAGSCYQKFEADLTWSEAQENCRDWHAAGHLVTIGGPEEQGIIDYLLDDEHPPTWIGLHDAGCGEYAWIDDTEITYENWLCDQTPSPEDVDSDPCVGLLLDGDGDCGSKKWAPMTCEANEGAAAPFGYICERPMGSDWTWSAGNAFCEANGYGLVTISFGEENAALATKLEEMGLSDQGAWIGLSDADAEGTWTWTSGDSASYMNWATEPNLDQENPDCGVIQGAGSGTWVPTDCEEENRGVICELGADPPD